MDGRFHEVPCERERRNQRVDLSGVGGVIDGEDTNASLAVDGANLALVVLGPDGAQLLGNERLPLIRGHIVRLPGYQPDGK
jgi:hypothetical protein